MEFPLLPRDSADPGIGVPEGSELVLRQSYGRADGSLKNSGTDSAIPIPAEQKKCMYIYRSGVISARPVISKTMAL